MDCATELDKRNFWHLPPPATSSRVRQLKGVQVLHTIFRLWTEGGRGFPYTRCKATGPGLSYPSGEKHYEGRHGLAVVARVRIALHKALVCSDRPGLVKTAAQILVSNVIGVKDKRRQVKQSCAGVHGHDESWGEKSRRLSARWWRVVAALGGAVRAERDAVLGGPIP